MMKTISTTLSLMMMAVAQSIAAQTTAATELTPKQWFEQGRDQVQRSAEVRQRLGAAKNVILIVGDGMGVSTVTAARILEGQQRGNPGEENLLSFENFPNVALSKTYSVNQQTSDSAPTMTAMVTGYKSNDGYLSVDHLIGEREANAEIVAKHSVQTILEQFELLGRSTGIVSTARITHATPAATYAHTPVRDWESDAELPAGATVKDIARQLIEFPIGNGLEVALGGGRTQFYPNTVADPEYNTRFGGRKDGRNLTTAWTARSAGHQYVWNKAQFDAINPSNTSNLLGLFERSHMQFEADRATDPAGEPSLTEMSMKALDFLSRNQSGYFLMVEAGRIDHAHHAGNAYRALNDTIEMSNAVRAIAARVDLNETLIIVTADHSHVMTIAGYPKRGNPILGKMIYPGESTPGKDMLGLPYTTLSYANGPGYLGASNTQAEGIKTFPHSPSTVQAARNGRVDLSTINTADKNYLQEATVPMSSETHAGEDVAIYAIGPMSHLVRGVMEQNAIFHVMAKAAVPACQSVECLLNRPR
jgi:alkaline phosphatase